MTLQTLHLLEQRLQRVHYILHGDAIETDTKPRGNDLPIAARLQKLEKSLEALKANSTVVQQLLRTHQCFPDSFQDSDENENTGTPSDATFVPLVLSHAPMYHSTASRLTSLNDVPLPETSLSANLISLMPKIEAATNSAARQEQQIADLRARSAEVVGRWHSLGVVGMGECWAEWESRLTVAERTLRREDAKKKREHDNDS